MELVERDSCTGCGACAKACPRQAIEFRNDEEGFPTPFIDKGKCIDCGLCNKVCPAIHMPETSPIRQAYAVQCTDREVLKESTSGGVFTVLAKEILSRGGVVYGCVWDGEYNAVVCKAESEEEIKPMRASKYVWSWAGDTFPEVKAHLEAGRAVLFTGLPCQVAGLKNYLRRDYENLFLLSFFCGGAPSPLAFREYLKTITRDVPLDKLDFKLRDKSRNGVGVHISYNTARGRVYQSYVQNSYFFSYHTKVFHRRPCYHCRYRYKDRVDDITMGDYWGIGKYHSEFDIRAGVSAVLVNTEKGAKLMEAVKDRLKISPTEARNIAAGNNLTLDDRQVVFKAPDFRHDFFEALKADGWTEAERKYLYDGTRKKMLIGNSLPARAFKKALRLLLRK